MTNAGNVSQIGCGHTHPTRPGVICARQRAHPENHHGRDETTGQVLTWPDAGLPDDTFVTEEREEPYAFTGDPWPEHLHPSLPVPMHVGELVVPKPPRTHRERVLSLVRVLLGLVVLVAILSAPAVVVAVYRWALT